MLVVLAIQTWGISSLKEVRKWRWREEEDGTVLFFFLLAFRTTLHFLSSLTPLTAKARINTGVSPLYRLAKLSFLT